jgi:hypothetical protein
MVGMVEFCCLGCQPALLLADCDVIVSKKARSVNPFSAIRSLLKSSDAIIAFLVVEDSAMYLIRLLLIVMTETRVLKTFEETVGETRRIVSNDVANKVSMI